MQSQCLRLSKITPSIDNSLDSEKTIVFCFFGRGKSSEVVKVKTLFPNSTIVGCSTAGSVMGTQISDNEIILSILKLEKSNFKLFYKPCLDFHHSEKVGVEIGTQLNQPLLKGIFLLTNGIVVNGSQISDGINSVIQNKIFIGGGMAGNGTEFKDTVLLKDDTILTNHAIAIGFYGDEIVCSSTYEGGWKNFGMVRKVTQSKGNVVSELDGKPALKVYKDFLGAQAANVTAFLHYPLSITNQDGEGDSIIRSILAVDEQTQSIVFAGDVEQGSYVRLMHSTNIGLTEAAENSTKRAVQNINKVAACFALVISCIGRRVVLDEYTEDELIKVEENLPSGTCMSGFYSYGEFSQGFGENCELHNQTLTIMVIQEAA